MAGTAPLQLISRIRPLTALEGPSTGLSCQGPAKASYAATGGDYSYAAKGIPIIFFTTGLHPDYHASSDEVSKILFDKLARITALVYEAGVHLANLDHAPIKDNKGPRAGKGTR